MKKLIASLLAVLMMLPVLAFAENSRQIPELNLVAGDHSGRLWKTTATPGMTRAPC